MESPTEEKKKSKFTYRHLQQLSKYSVDSPLRVIALVDLDAFYAQCEMKRLGVPPEQPLAVQQWQNLIAVNYPSREKGVTRHMTATEAKKLCPEIHLAHVATWKAGESHWAYRASPNINDSKACLDPYRTESKKILSVFQTKCPNARTEKASIDESFLDLSKDIYDQLLLQYEALRSPGNPNENLPLPDVQALDWHDSHLVANDEVDSEDVDWDDVAMAIGAGIVKGLRDEVFKQLGYTCSAGIASNKMIAKLGAGYKKPDQQSVVRTSAVQPFLNTFKFTKIRNLGGKLGTQIAEHFKTESLTDLLNVSLGQFQTLLPDDTATWVYNVIRGHDRSLVEPKSSIKSMLSAKSFREPIRSLQEAQSWLQVFIADISSRLDDEPTGRRPKTMALHFSTKNGPTRNKQLSIPAAGKFNKDALLKLADRLLDTVVAAEPGAFPCTGMSLQVAGLEDREEGNMGIDAFLLKGQQAADANNKRRMSTPVAVEEEEEKKRPRLDGGIGRFFTAKDPQVMLDSDEGKKSPPALPDTDPNSFPTFYCPECAADLPGEEQEQAEHKDWHFAKALEQEDRAAARRPPPPPPPAPPRGGGNGNKKKKNGGGGKNNKLEKGQSLLKF